MKTIYFSNCMAAFEGGGVRGAAYAGAYAAAVEAGIRFSRVAGSSAGSVIAALVAAGATPESLKTRMLETNFSELRTPAKSEDKPFKEATLTGAARLLRIVDPRLAKALASGGMFSTSMLRDWIERNLREILIEQGKAPSSELVRFRDLPLPLHIVATDVLQKAPKIWSSENTPDDSVSLAVQASCAIPLYFQPVSSGASVLVDGGAVSNLPTYVFPNSSGNPGRFSEKTLAFRLKSAPSAPAMQFKNAMEYALGIADTLITSATLIQQALQATIFNIEIDTGDIKATDFDKMTLDIRNKLYENGARAVHKFISQEREIVGRQQIASQFDGFDRRLLVYVDAFLEARSTIWVSDYSTYWLWFIFPALASAMSRGVQVRMTAGRAHPSKVEQERQRRSLLKSMGCEVDEVESVSFTGILVDYPGPGGRAIISSEQGAVGQDFTYGHEKVKVYTTNEDLPVITSLGVNVAKQVGRGAITASRRETPAIQTMRIESIFALLRNVRQYQDANFTLQEITLDDSLRVTQTHIKEFKLLQVSKLADEMDRSGIDLFAPCCYQLADKSTSIITPPVAEMTPQGPVLIEGHTRAFYAARLGRARLKVIIVSDVKAPLPIQPLPFSDLRIAHETMDASENMPGYDKALYRYIETAVHPQA